MAYYNVCSKCGATLDPGEICDCEIEQEKRNSLFDRKISLDCVTGQYSLVLGGKEALCVKETADQT